MAQLRLSPKQVREVLGWDVGYSQRDHFTVQDDKELLLVRLQELDELPLTEGDVPDWTTGLHPAYDMEAHKSGAVTLSNERTTDHDAVRSP